VDVASVFCSVQLTLACLLPVKFRDFLTFLKDKDDTRNPFDYASRHSSDALDRGAAKVLELSPFHSAGSAMEMTQFERHKTQQQKLIQRAASSEAPSDDQVTTVS